MKCVSDIEKDVTSLNIKYEEVRDKKAQALRKSKRDLKNKMKKAIDKVIQLLQQCPQNILVDKLPEPVIYEGSVPSIGDEYPTLKKALEDIQTLLERDAVKCVAVHGEKGVGKTTIMRNLNNCLYDGVDKLFDLVIFIKVPFDGQTNLQILQKVAHRIKVDAEGNAPEIAGRIREILKNKKYLLILDGVRHPIDGIWDCLDISKAKNGSKVVITTHYPLAYKSKYVNMKVKVEKLSPADALKMFRDIAGDNHLQEQDARLICNRFCSGLPLLIDRIAKSFNCQESPPDWQKALNEFILWPEVGVDGLEELYSHLKIFYDLLKDESKQKCFRYASLHPADSKIYTEYLLECCIAEGFLGTIDADTKYSEMRSRGIKTILRHLVNVSFLDEEEQMKYVKVNDCNRQLALYISSKDSECRSYVDVDEHKKPSRLKFWQHARWVSMIGSERDSLPTNQDCCMLQTLLLQKNLKLVEIPPAYFDNMRNLRVLNLYGTKIRKLPSLSGLTSLKVFYLNGCSDLKMLSSEIEPLQHLEVLDIRGTGAIFVPCLNNLRCLRTSYNIASNDQSGDEGNYQVIPELRILEELIIEVKSLQQWFNDAECLIQKVTLENLTTFKCIFPSSEILERFLENSRTWRGEFQFLREGKILNIQKNLSLL